MKVCVDEDWCGLELAPSDFQLNLLTAGQGNTRPVDRARINIVVEETARHFDR